MNVERSGAPHLKRELGAFQFFTLAFGAVVGVGWAVVLGDWLQLAGPLGAILGLAAGGAVVMLVGLCYAEVSTLIPVSGGEVAFAYEVFGPRTAFLTGWLLAITYIAFAAFEAISIGWVLGALVPGIEGPVIYTSLGGEVRAGTLGAGLVGMTVLTWLNYRGAKPAARLQQTLVTALLVMAVTFIAAGIVRGDAANLHPYFQRSSTGSLWPGVLAMFMSAFAWFGGFEIVPKAMEESAPGTRLSRVGLMIVLAIGLGVMFKTMVVLSAAMSMPWRELTKTAVPSVMAFRAAFGAELLAKLVLVTALFGLLSTWNAVLVGGSRVLYSLGRAAFISPRFAGVSVLSGVPSFAIAITGLVGAAGTLLGRNALLPIVNVASACLTVAYLLTCLAVIRLRRRAPALPRPFRVPGGVMTAWAGVAGSSFGLALSLYQPYAAAKGKLPLEWAVLGVWLAIGVAFWAAGRTLRDAVSEGERRRVIMGGGAAVQKP